MRRKLAENIKRVRERIAAACARRGRKPESVRLVAVTKTVEIDVIRMALDAGLTDLGENRVQELVKRAGMLREHISRRRAIEREDIADPRWHMIGHLQRNKVRAVLPWIDMLHSLDSLRLAEEVSEEAQRLGRTIPCLIEVNVSGEKSKYGIAVGAVEHLARVVSTLPGLKIVGLMTMAPLVENPEEARPCFARLADIFADLRHEGFLGRDFRELSMGMSNDYEVAIEEGATIIRLGRAIFEGVAPPGPND